VCARGGWGAAKCMLRIDMRVKAAGAASFRCSGGDFSHGARLAGSVGRRTGKGGHGGVHRARGHVAREYVSVSWR